MAACRKSPLTLSLSRRLFAATLHCDPMRNLANKLGERVRTFTVQLTYVLSAILISLSSSSAAAVHPVSVTRTLVYVTRARIDVTIEVFLEDLYLFHNLKPNQADFLDAATIQRGIELHQTFVAQRFVIRDADGSIRTPDQPPKVTAAIPEDGVSLADLMAHKLTFAMQYHFPAPPDFLTFEQQFTDADGVLLSEMQLQVRQENAGDTISKALVPNLPETIRFDWTNPPLSKDASEQEREQWATQQQQETLGITSYSSVYSFLYIENHEVRHEILIPLLTLEQSVPLNRAQKDFLTVQEQEAVRPLIEEFFMSGNPIEVDGVRPVPVVERCDFYGVNFRDLAQVTDRKPVAMSSARAGIILSYPVASAPRNLRLTWDRFHKSLWAVNMIVFTGDKAFRKTLSRIGANNIFEWTSPKDSPVTQELPLAPVVAELPAIPTVRVPALSLIALALSLASLIPMARRKLRSKDVWTAVPLLCAAAASWIFDVGTFTTRWGSPPQISHDEARRVVTQLMANAYEAFRYRGENEVYDALAVSTSGEVLEELYLQIQQSLRMAEQGGAVARVKQIDIIEAVRQAPPSTGNPPQSEFAFTCLCRWNITGTVEHWGHIHQRTNQFQASLLVEPIPVHPDDVTSTEHHWKLTRIDVTDSQRLHFETRLRQIEAP